MKRTKFYYILLFVLVALTFTVEAKAQAIHITGNVYKTMKEFDGSGSGKLPLSAPVYVFDNKNEAYKQANIFRSQDKMFGVVKINSNDVVVPDYEGHFEADVSTNGALLIINEGLVKVIEIVGSKLNYEIAFTSTDNDGIMIKNVDVLGKRRGVDFKELPPLDDGATLHWNVGIGLPAWYTTKHSRLIFQPVVVDIETQDTLQYLDPLVFEGEPYHVNQIRRKSYNFERNDSLHSFYSAEPVMNDGNFAFKWEYTYPKPDPDKNYKWTGTVSLEDYTHVYFKEQKQGTTNSRKPWKMLKITTAAKEMALQPKFYEQVRARLSEVPRDLQLTFVVGTDELTPDSTNKRDLDMLVQELRSYGRSLMNFTIQGTASPEGNLAKNIDLARKRARKVLNMISSSISTAGLQIKEPMVFTWSDVADSLAARGQNYEAEDLRKYAKENNIAGIGRMMVSNPTIGEILQNQRLIKTSYTIRRNKIMEPREALWTYQNDARYVEGGTEKFSNGDYYNLFTLIKDSAELRKLTFRAYNEIKTRKTSKYSPFAAYIANRVAYYLLDQDSINLSVLEPFIDMQAGLEVSRPIAFDNSYMYTVNYPEVVANQALMYLKSRKLAQAAYLANKLPDIERFHELKMLIDLESLFFKMNKTPEEEERARRALDYVMNINPINKVVLSFELAPELGLTYSSLEPTIDALPDDMAEKWYLKGVIAANDPDIDEDNFSQLIDLYGAEMALKIQANGTPNFLAYFQHAFDMNPIFYDKFYKTDANVSDDTRAKYPYDINKVKDYREKFNFLIMQPKNEVPE